jgi:hypothetical protein
MQKCNRLPTSGHRFASSVLITTERDLPAVDANRIRWRAPVVFLLIAFCACQSGSGSPEDQIRALIAKGEKAAEEKDIGTLKEIIHDGYTDKDGNKKPELVKLLAYHLLRHQSVHLLTRIRTIEFPQPKRSEATVFVGMAAGSLGSIDDLLKMRADLYRVEVSLLEESPRHWKVASASWRPAELADFE